MKTEQKTPFNHDVAAASVLRVGDGRGFVVEGKRGRYIITAAHCLPFLPPSTSIAFTEERTYQELVGQIGAEPTVWAECVFVDPIADIAVLAAPDSQDMPDQCDEYENLLDRLPALSIGEAPQQAQGWLLSLECKWFSCKVHHVGGPLWTTGATDGIMGGMSGSPILLDDGSAAGVVVAGGGGEGKGDAPTEGGPDPWLMGNLPGWLLRELEAN